MSKRKVSDIYGATHLVPLQNNKPQQRSKFAFLIQEKRLFKFALFELKQTIARTSVVCTKFYDPVYKV